MEPAAESNGITPLTPFFRNSASGNTNNFSIVGLNTVGPIVTNVGTLATSGTDAHPWANFFF